MSLRLGPFFFDYCDDVLQIPAWSTQPFRQPGRLNAGIALTPPAGEPFRIQATRYDVEGAIPGLQTAYEGSVGFAYAAEQFGVQHDFTHGVLYLVLDVRIVEARKIVHVSGTRNGTAFSHSPASMVVAEFELIAVPA